MFKFFIFKRFLFCTFLHCYWFAEFGAFFQLSDLTSLTKPKAKMPLQQYTHSYAVFDFRKFYSACIHEVGGSRSGALKVHKRENFLGSDFEICTFS
jgi:hypothetical protein